MNKIKGWIYKAELNRYLKTPIDKPYYSPIILEVWKDGEDMRDSVCGAHLQEVEITIKVLTNTTNKDSNE